MPERQAGQSVIPELLKSLIPITPMGKVMLLGIAVWFADWTFATERTLFGSRAAKTLFDVASALALIPLGYFLVRGARWVTQHLLWRLRRRLDCINDECFVFQRRIHPICIAEREPVRTDQ